MEISNVKLLLWCAANTEGVCKFGDFFDKSIRLSYKKSETECIDASLSLIYRMTHFGKGVTI